jgi:hypothetical protein
MCNEWVHLSQPSVEELLGDTVVKYKVNTDEWQVEEAFTGVAVLRHSLSEDTRTSRRIKNRIEGCRAREGYLPEERQ